MLQQYPLSRFITVSTCACASVVLYCINALQ